MQQQRTQSNSNSSDPAMEQSIQLQLNQNSNNNVENQTSIQTTLQQTKNKQDLENQFRHWYKCTVRKYEIYFKALTDSTRPGQDLEEKQFVKIWKQVASELKLAQFSWGERTLKKYYIFYTYKDELLAFYEKFGKELFVENGIPHASFAKWYTIITSAVQMKQGSRTELKYLKWFDELALEATQKIVKKIQEKERQKQQRQEQIQVHVEAEEEQVDETDEEDLDESEREEFDETQEESEDEFFEIQGDSKAEEEESGEEEESQSATKETRKRKYCQEPGEEDTQEEQPNKKRKIFFN